MQQHKFSKNKMNDLKERGWSDMSKRLDAHMPVKKNALWKKRILLLLLALLLVLGGIRIGQSTWFNKRASIAFNNSSNKNINQPVVNEPAPVIIRDSGVVSKWFTGANDSSKTEDFGSVSGAIFGKSSTRNKKEEGSSDLDRAESKDQRFNEQNYFQISKPSLKSAQASQIEHVNLRSNGIINSELNIFNGNNEYAELFSLKKPQEGFSKDNRDSLGQNVPMLKDSLLIISEDLDSTQNDSLFADTDEFDADSEIIRPIKLKEKQTFKVYYLDVGAGITATQSVNLSGYYYLGLNRLVKSKLLVGVQFGHSFLSLNDFVTYNANITKPYSVTSQGSRTLIEAREYN
jgi:hypothetical protein